MKKMFKTLISGAPIKSKVFMLLRKFWRPGSSIYKHFHFIGIISVPIDGKKSFKMKHYGYQVENDIFWAGLTGGWEKESLKLWINLCQRSIVILDIGANTGVYSLVAKTVNNQAKVFAFEPVRRIFQKLSDNIALNKYDITSVEAAVSNTDGTSKIYNTDSEHTYSASLGRKMNIDESRILQTNIKTIRLSSFIKRNNLTRIDLMKVDVEMHEAEVLEGLGDYLITFKPTLLIEILDDTIGEKVHQMVKKLEYLYFNIDEKKSIHQVKKIVKSNYNNYLLCSHSVALGLGLLGGASHEFQRPSKAQF